MSIIEHEVPRQALLHLLPLRHMGLEILEVVLSPWNRGVGKRLSEMSLPRDCLVSLIIRNGSFVIPAGDTLLLGGDELIVMAKSEREEELRACLLGPS